MRVGTRIVLAVALLGVALSAAVVIPALASSSGGKVLVSLTATLPAQGQGSTPTGTIVWTIAGPYGGHPLCKNETAPGQGEELNQSAPTGGTAWATCEFKVYPGKVHATATYGGDANYNPAAGSYVGNPNKPTSARIFLGAR